MKSVLKRSLLCLSAALLSTAVLAAGAPPTAAPTPASAAAIPSNQYGSEGGGSDFNLPQIGEAGAAAVSPQEEYSIGVQIIDELRESGAILEDPQIQQYIHDIGMRLASHSDNPSLHFAYYLIDDDDINATTLPGGFVVVNSGLFLLTKNEDELAGVMAHETGHVTQRHLARQVEDESDHAFLNIATMLAALIAASRTSDPDVAVGALATAQGEMIQHQINYTR
ncbi:MAG TPA: M48 family metalloprotease, partial [Gammaproteobacteria bacterium]